MQRHARSRALAANFVWALALAGGASLAQTAETSAAALPRVVVMPHANGSLGLPIDRIATVWHLPASAEKPTQVRLTSPVLGEPKTLSGSDAEALWATLHGGPLSTQFVFASHMQGTLAIPRAQVHTAYYTEDRGKPTLRLVYEADPSGKTVEGDEATRLWQALRD